VITTQKQMYWVGVYEYEFAVICGADDV